MSKKGKSYSAEFKTKVVLELLRQEETASVVAHRYGITVQMLNQWKKRFLQNASLAFDVDGAPREYGEKIEKLEKEYEMLAMTLGNGTLERDWAVGKLRSLDLSSKKGLVTSESESLKDSRRDLLFEEYKILEKKIRDNQNQERFFIQLFFTLIGGYLLTLKQIGEYIGILQPLLLILFPFLFIMLLILLITRLKEIFSSGGYKKAIEEKINDMYGIPILLWESKIVPKTLRDKSFGRIFWTSYLLVIFLGALGLYFSAYNSYSSYFQKNGANYFYYLGIFIGIFIFIIFIISLYIVTKEIFGSAIEKSFTTSYKEACEYLKCSR